jgi:transcriptional regulator with XRE-family HTH domain
MQKTIYSQSYSKVTKWLKEARKEKSLTMRQLAKILEVQHSIIWNIENNERRLDIVEYVNYCEKLNIDPTIGINIIRNKL